MSLQDYYNEFCNGYWANPDPNRCLCRGCGWASSDLDTWHECPYHYNGQRHPEDEPDDCPEMQWKPKPTPVEPPLTDADIPF